MRITRHSLFATLSLAVLFAPAVLMGVHQMHVPLPEPLAPARAHLLEGRESQGLPTRKLSAIMDGSFQEELEQFTCDHIPQHDRALDASAALQRMGIAQAARLHGFGVYPTYYGSDYLFEPDEGAVWHRPIEADPEACYGQRMRTFGEGIVEVAARHPEMRFVVVAPAGGAMPAVNPAYPLMANAQRPQPLLEVLRESLGGAPNVVLVTNVGDYADEDAYLAQYCRTDHHWNAEGCACAYNEAAAKLDLAPVQVQPLMTLGANRGSYARAGLVAVEEDGMDMAQRFPGVCLVDPDAEDDADARIPVDDHAFYDPGSPEGYYDFYNRYYRQVQTYTGPGTGVALVVCDSFAAPMMAPIAANYEVTHRVEDLYQKPGSPSLEALLAQTRPQDVWIVGIPADFMSLVSREEGYFDVAEAPSDADAA